MTNKPLNVHPELWGPACEGRGEDFPGFRGASLAPGPLARELTRHTLSGHTDTGIAELSDGNDPDRSREGIGQLSGKPVQMDFTALRYFCETAQTGSVRAASERLRVAPSAISRQITKLEHELRTPIFDRRAHGMTLTAAGEVLQSQVEGMMREMDRAKSHIAALQNLQSGTVDIYCFQSAIETFIPPVLQELYVKYPDISFNIRSSNTAETISALINRTAEIGLLVDPPFRDTILTRELFRDTIVAAVAPHHPLAAVGTVSLREIAEFPLALIEPSFALRQQVDAAFNRCAISPNIYCVTNSLSLLKHIGRFERPCVLLPRFIVEEAAAAGTLCRIIIEELDETQRLYCLSVLKRRALSPAAKVFSDAVASYCRRYEFLPTQ